MIKRTYPSWRYRYGGSAHTFRSRYRYGGSGVFSKIIGRSIAEDSVKHLINKVVRSKISQKVAGAVVEGATDFHMPEVIGELASAAIKNYTETRRRKRERQDIINSVIHQLSPKQIPTISSVEEIINSGKGIVYD